MYNVFKWGGGEGEGSVFPNNIIFVLGGCKIFLNPYLVYGDLFVEFVDCLVILEHNRCQ
jgi:hypothetical protein